MSSNDPTTYRANDPATRARKQIAEFCRQIMERKGSIEAMEKNAQEGLAEARRSGDKKLLAECQRYLQHTQKTKESYERMNADALKAKKELEFQHGKG